MSITKRKSSKVFPQVIVVMLMCCLLFMCFFSAGTAFSSEEAIDYSLGHDGADEVGVAAVNGTEITMAMLLRKMRDLAIKRAGQEEITPLVAQKLRDEALEILITEELAFQKSFAKVGHVSPEKIDRGLVELSDQYGGADAFAEYLKREGVSPGSYRDQVERNLVVREFIRQEFDDAVVVSQEEIDSVYLPYDTEKTKYLTQKEKIQVAEIKLFLDPESAESIKQAQAFRDKIITNYGGDLDKIPQDGTFYITKNVTLNENGDKGLYAAGKKLADAQKSNGLSEPVISDGVVKIIQLTGHTAETVKSIEAVRYELKQKKKMALVKNWVAGLKNGANIEVFDIMQ